MRQKICITAKFVPDYYRRYWIVTCDGCGKVNGLHVHETYATRGVIAPLTEPMWMCDNSTNEHYCPDCYPAVATVGQTDAGRREWRERRQREIQQELTRE